MKKIKFVINLKDTIIITDKWVCNGHWAVSKDIALHNNSFSKVSNWSNGRYSNSVLMSSDVSEYDKTLDSFTEKKQNDFALDISTARSGIDLTSNDSAMVRRVQFKGNVGIDINYFPLLSLGTEIIASTEKEPIRVINNNKVTAIIMPLRK